MREANDFVPVYVSIWVVQMKVISSKITSLESPLFGSLLSSLQLPPPPTISSVSKHVREREREANETERCWSGMKDGLERWNKGRGVRGRKPTFFNSNFNEKDVLLLRVYHDLRSLCVLFPLFLPLHPSSHPSLFPFFYFPSYAKSFIAHRLLAIMEWILVPFSCSHSSLQWMKGRKEKNKKAGKKNSETDERG